MRFYYLTLTALLFALLFLGCKATHAADVTFNSSVTPDKKDFWKWMNPESKSFSRDADGRLPFNENYPAGRYYLVIKITDLGNGRYRVTTTVYAWYPTYIAGQYIGGEYVKEGDVTNEFQVTQNGNQYTVTHIRQIGTPELPLPILGLLSTGMTGAFLRIRRLRRRLI